MLDKSVESGIYNMADDEALFTNELTDVMCSAMGKNAHIWRINERVVLLVARFGDMLHLSLNTFRLNKLMENYVVSNAKIKQASGGGDAYRCSLQSCINNSKFSELVEYAIFFLFCWFHTFVWPTSAISLINRICGRRMPPLPCVVEALCFYSGLGFIPHFLTGLWVVFAWINFYWTG